MGVLSGEYICQLTFCMPYFASSSILYGTMIWQEVVHIRLRIIAWQICVYDIHMSRKKYMSIYIMHVYIYSDFNNIYLNSNMANHACHIIKNRFKVNSLFANTVYRFDIYGKRLTYVIYKFLFLNQICLDLFSFEYDKVMT